MRTRLLGITALATLTLAVAPGCSSQLGDEPSGASSQPLTNEQITAALALCKPDSQDRDRDGLCDEAEGALSTNPLLADTDGDALGDGAEVKAGANGVDLHAHGSDPRHKDIYIYFNWYANRKPAQAALDQVVAAFAAAPVKNPDGADGITLHVEDGGQVAPADAIANLNVWVDVDTIKGKYFPAKFAPYFHYVIFANQYGGGTSSGISRGIPAHDLIVTLGTWSTPGGTVLQQAGTLMHEFGHNLGLHHGGDEDTNYKPNYLSIMSYRYQIVGLHRGGADGVMDYSRFEIGAVSEAALNERTGLRPANETTKADIAPYRLKGPHGLLDGSAAANIDFNRNGAIDPGTVAVDLDGDGLATGNFKISQNDWTALRFDGAGTIGDPGVAAARGFVTYDVAPEDMHEPEIEHP